MQFRLVYPTSLAPYMPIPRAGTALVFSVVFTLAALLIFGYVKGRFTGARPIRSAIQTALNRRRRRGDTTSGPGTSALS